VTEPSRLPIHQVFLKPGPQKVLEERRAAVLLAAGRKLISFIKMVAIRHQFLRIREATVILQRCTATACRCRGRRVQWLTSLFPPKIRSLYAQ